MRPRLTVHQVGWKGVWSFVRSPKTPVLPKLLAVLAVVYLLWPADLVPDFLPVLGWLDDVGFVVAAMGYLRYCAGKVTK